MKITDITWTPAFLDQVRCDRDASVATTVRCAACWRAIPPFARYCGGCGRRVNLAPAPHPLTDRGMVGARIAVVRAVEEARRAK